MKGEGAYRLGVDIGTCMTSAATSDDVSASILSLGNDGHDMPSVVAITEGRVLVGEAANRRARTDPQCVVREFKRRMGDDTPLLVANQWVTPQWLTAQLLAHVVARAQEERGCRPDQVTLSHPANWRSFRQELLLEAARLAGLEDVDLIPEPVSAARFAADDGRLEIGRLAAIFDLGGGTFDTALVRRTDSTGFELVGEAGGLERLGGIDLDQALFEHVLRTLDLDLRELPETPAVMASVAQLRDDVVDAKEQLSFDTSTVLPVMIDGHQTRIRLTRSEFEDLARPLIDRAIDSVEIAITQAGVERQDIDVIVPVGGSSRVPLVSERLSARLGTPIVGSANPRHAVALGTTVAIATLDSASPPPPGQRQLRRADVPEPPAPPGDERGDDTTPQPADTAKSENEGASSPSTASQPPSSNAEQGRRSRSRLLLLGSLLGLLLVVGIGWVITSGRPSDEATIAGDGAPTGEGAAGDGAQDDASHDDRAASSSADAVPTSGFAFGGAVGTSIFSSAAPAPFHDPGPVELPQPGWQSRFEGLFQRALGHDGSLLLAGSESSSGGFSNHLIALDPVNGSTRWRYGTVDFLNTFFVGDDGVLVLSTADVVAAGGTMGDRELRATLLDPSTGGTVAEAEISPRSVDVALDQLMAATLHDNVIVTSWHDGAELISSAFDLESSELLWEERDPAPSFSYDGRASEDVFVVIGDELLIARDLRTGERLWSTTELTLFDFKTVGGDVIVVGRPGRTDYRALDLRTGEVRWNVAEGRGSKFAADDQFLFVVLEQANTVHSVDLSDGSLRWEEQVLDLATPLDLIRAGDDHLLLLDESAVRAFDTRNGELLWQRSLTSDGLSPHLTTAGEVLIVQDQELLTSFG